MHKQQIRLLYNLLLKCEERCELDPLCLRLMIHSEAHMWAI